MASNEQSQVVVVIVPFPAHGHVNQLLHLSRLILAYNIPVHCVGTPIHTHQAILRLQSYWDPYSSSHFHLHHFHLPPSHDSDTQTRFPSSHFIPSFEAFNSHYLREPVASLLFSLSSVSRRVVVIYDSLMASVVQDASGIPNAETYTFHSVSAFTMSLFFWEGKGKPSVENICIPEEVPSLEGCFTTQFLNFISAQHKFHKFSKGNIYNTTRDIEGPYVQFIERINCTKKHWALGPFNPLVIERKISSQRRHFSLEWLDKQENNSVIYVSFGTTTTFKEEQIKQLAIGLEESEVRFIWVLRDADKGDDFDVQVTRDEQYMKGFEERVKGTGLVIRDWAPQLEILSHRSTGGFMSHCGWNSCMESITMGVPMATWPVHSDQPRNRVLVTEMLQMGLMVRDWAHRDELVKASVVKNAVRRLMATKEGDEMRKKAMNLKNVVLQSSDEGGVSRSEMEAFIAHITRL